MTLSSTVPPAITTIVFDVGKVLVDFNFDSFVSFISNRGAQVASTGEFIERTRLLDYETGALTDEQFLGNINLLLEHPAAHDELTHHWRRVFSPIPEMLELAVQCKLRYRVFLLSNTNPLHWSYLEETFNLQNRSHGAMTSFRAKAMKPALEIYQATADAFSLEPAQTVFIDDIQKHVTAAQGLGWHALKHEGYQATLDALRRLGVQPFV